MAVARWAQAVNPQALSRLEVTMHSTPAARARRPSSMLASRPPTRGRLDDEAADGGRLPEIAVDQVERLVDG